jgi:hypothetical protein
VAGVGAIQAVGWIIKEGTNIFYSNCTVKDKSLDCQGISLGAMIFISAERFIMESSAGNRKLMQLL